MLNAKDSPAMTDYDVGTDNEKARQRQWRKLSRKRRRNLILRSLRKLEKEAEDNAVYIGLDDYSHVQSLVFSELPFNPNGHHCSCNCLDEIQDDPELEVYGWNYGKLLKNSDHGYDSDDENDDVLLSNYGTLSTPAERQVTSIFETEVDLKTAGSEQHSARSYMGGSLDLKPISSIGDEIHDDVLGSSRSILSRGLSTGRSELQDGMETSEYDRRIVSSHRGLASSHYENEKGRRRESRKKRRPSCFCSGVVSRAKTGRSSITSEMMRAGTSARSVCSKCQNLLDIINNFRNLPSSRRLSRAKTDGSLRSRIFGLRQKLRHYNDLIERKEYLTVQEKVKRKLTIGDQLQRKALGLSDSLKLMKIKESYYRSKNIDLQHRLTTNSQDEDSDYELDEEEKLKANPEEEKSGGIIPESSGLGDNNSFLTNNTFNRSPRKTGRRRKDNELPALLEEDEESIREQHSSEGRIENSVKGTQENEDQNSYDILFVNHSDNEVEGPNKNDEDTQDSEESDDEDLTKSWPAYKRNSLKLNFWRDYDAKKKDRRASIALRKLVHRFDSGMTFGSSEMAVFNDDSLMSSLSKIDEEKSSKGILSEDDYYKPLVERQKSFGDAIRDVIRQEIRKRTGSSVASEKLEDEQDSEDEDALEKEKKRKKSIHEENIKEFVEEAKRKKEIVEQQLQDKDSGIAELRRITDGEEDGNESGSPDEFHNRLGLNDRMNPSRTKLVNLSTLRTLAEKHKTLKSLRNLDEEVYEVGQGIDKLNNYRMKDAYAKVSKQEAKEGNNDIIPLSDNEKKFSIPEAKNRKSIIEDEIANNKKKIAKIDFQYDMVRDLRFLILNQNTSRANTFSYFKPAPPYLKTKWQQRIKRGFLRGVKEQKVNENQLEKVEDVTYKTIDRREIHKETLKKAMKEKQKGHKDKPSTSSLESRLSTSRQSSIALSRQPTENTNVKLPPLKLPSSRGSSPIDSVFDESGRQSRSMSVGGETLRTAFKKLKTRHKFLEKESMMRSVIRLSSYSKNDVPEDVKTDTIETNRSNSESEQRFTSRLKSNRRQSIAAVQNFATRDQMSGRVSVNSNEGRRLSLMQPIQEY